MNTRAGRRNRQAWPQATFPPAPPAPPGATATLAQSRPLLGHSSLARGLDLSMSAILQEEERCPQLRICPSTTPGGSKEYAEDCLRGAHRQGWGSSWRTLTGLADHVSQVPGFLGRVVIPAASGHLGGRSHRHAVSIVDALASAVDQGTPTACLFQPPGSAQLQGHPGSSPPHSGCPPNPSR